MNTIFNILSMLLSNRIRRIHTAPSAWKIAPTPFSLRSFIAIYLLHFTLVLPPPSPFSFIAIPLTVRHCTSVPFRPLAKPHCPSPFVPSLPPPSLVLLNLPTDPLDLALPLVIHSSSPVLRSLFPSNTRQHQSCARNGASSGFSGGATTATLCPSSSMLSSTAPARGSACGESFGGENRRVRARAHLRMV
ncbi:hypothetical protein B0H14DRAFT_2997332 [Mycena olivaceomarginata]|nr:hypothetical protein B0H14DRAFT_2997332 [Mycena olivaceomarginata]